MNHRFTSVGTRVIFFALVFLCLSALALSFYSWNKERDFSSNTSETNEKSLKYSIDSCETSSGTLSVKGWIFNAYYPRAGKLIITFNGREGEIQLPLFTYVRGDVSRVFGRTDDFDNVGFNASISKSIIRKMEEGAFNFYILDAEGKMNKVARYECKN